MRFCQSLREIIIMSDYSGWMPSQIKIELRRRGARANGQKADLVQKSSVRRDA